MVGNAVHAGQGSQRDDCRGSGSHASGAGAAAPWRARPCLPGRRRRARPAARPRARLTSTLSWSRATPAGLAASAGRRGPRARALRHGQGRARMDTSSTSPPRGGRATRIPVRCRRSCRPRRSTTDLASPRLHRSTRWQSPCTASRTWSTPTVARRIWCCGGCGCCTTTRSPTTRPGRSAPRATRRASASSWRRPSELIREADLATVSTDRRERGLARASRPKRAPRGARLCSPSGVAGRCGPGGAVLGRERSRSCSTGAAVARQSAPPEARPACCGARPDAR